MRCERSVDSYKIDFSHHLRQYGILYCVTKVARMRTCALKIVRHVTSSLRQA
jgi:hypothetical protein